RSRMVALDRARLDHMEAAAGRSRAQELEAGRGAEGAVLVERALAPSRCHEHVEVGELRLGLLVGLAEQTLGEQEPAAVRDRRSAAAEDRGRLLVLPVV